MATRCRDCDTVPKVADAGMVFEQGDGSSVQVMHNGLRMQAGGYYGQWMTDLIRLCRGHHETQEERLFHEVESRLSPDATMIELGGFWSYYSLWFLLNEPGRRAVVIEPDPVHLEVGKSNARLNGLSPHFQHGFAGGTFSPAEPFRCEVSGELEMPRFSVTHLMESEGWATLDLLHCDIQGAETEVLESCRDLFLAGKVRWVFVSTHAHQISGDPLTHQRCLSLLRECGAVIEAEHDVHESFSGDGLIVARFGAPPAGWTPVRLSSNRASSSLFRHLAYDLDESLRRAEWLDAQVSAQAPERPLHSALTVSGALYTLQADGPLGKAGDTFVLPHDEVMRPGVEALASWDLGDLEAFAAKVDPAQNYTLIDVGANIGLFSRQAALRLPAITAIHCVEPDPRNFRALHYNLCGVDAKVEFHHVALDAADGEAELMRDAMNFGNYSLNPDAMRDRSFDSVRVPTRGAAEWLIEQVGSGTGRLLWKSDTQGLDEVIVSRVPADIWERVDVAIMELWRIAKPDFDKDEFCRKIMSFEHRSLGERVGVTPAEVMEYLTSDDWQFKDLLLWR